MNYSKLNLRDRIALLPVECQIQIDEFNIEHRPKMKKVVDMFTRCQPYRLTCDVCDITKISLCHSSYVYNVFVCSKICHSNYPLISRHFMSGDGCSC
jgi:hypothetical protein